MLSALTKVTITMTSSRTLSIYYLMCACHFNVILLLSSSRVLCNRTLWRFRPHRHDIDVFWGLLPAKDQDLAFVMKWGNCWLRQYLPESEAAERWLGCFQGLPAVRPQRCTSTGAQAPLPGCWTPGSRGSTCTPTNSPSLPRGWE